MVTLLILIIGEPLLIAGIHTITKEGMIGYPVKKWMTEKIPLFLYMPIIGCMTCMASFWTMALFLPLTILPEFNYKFSIAILPYAMIVNAFTNSMLERVLTTDKQRDGKEG